MSALSLAPFITALETWKSIPGTDCIFTSGTCAEAEMRCPHCRVVGEGVQAAGWGRAWAERSRAGESTGRKHLTLMVADRWPSSAQDPPPENCPKYLREVCPALEPRVGKWEQEQEILTYWCKCNSVCTHRPRDTGTWGLCLQESWAALRISVTEREAALKPSFLALKSRSPRHSPHPLLRADRASGRVCPLSQAMGTQQQPHREAH